MKKKELLSQNTRLKETIAKLKYEMFKSKLQIAVDMLSELGAVELTDTREAYDSDILTLVVTINNY